MGGEDVSVLPPFYPSSQLMSMQKALVLLTLTVAFAATAARGDAAFTGFLPGTGMLSIPVTSMHGERYLGIVRQHTDYSCGAAAVATILKYGYDVQDATEDSVIEGMLKVSDPTAVRQRGFSLLDVKNYVTSLGLLGAGFRISYQQLLAIKVPTVILLNENGYLHFVVFRKATPLYVFVADPIRGNQRFTAEDFVGLWNGIIFVIAPGTSGLTYDRTNVLEQVHAPPTMTQMANGMPPLTTALNAALLQTIYIPGIDRL
jgi:predicted double-glycine peptidase